MKGYLLTLTALILILLLAPIAVLFSFYRKMYFMQLAISLDKFGNVLMQYVFNFLFIKKHGYKFGNSCDTVSRVLGVNKHYNRLSLIGKGLAAILNFFDPNHVENAANDQYKMN